MVRRRREAGDLLELRHVRATAVEVEASPVVSARQVPLVPAFLAKDRSSVRADVAEAVDVVLEVGVTCIGTFTIDESPIHCHERAKTDSRHRS
jgi:hypothetical protein